MRDAVVDLVLIAVDVKNRPRPFEARGVRASLPHIQTAADDHQAIRARDREVGPSIAVATDHAGIQRML